MMSHLHKLPQHSAVANPWLQGAGHRPQGERPCRKDEARARLTHKSPDDGTPPAVSSCGTASLH